MKHVHIIGEGRWGGALKTKLTNMGIRVTTNDLLTRPDYSADGVIIATPPPFRYSVIYDAIQNGVKVLRVEKPLGVSVASAKQYAQLCADAGVELTVGFTLLYHPAYAAIAQGDALVIRARRIGPARHDIPAELDLGIHIAAVAAYHDAAFSLESRYSDCWHARWTEMQVRHSANVIVDEVTNTITGPFGVHVQTNPDPLERDLAAWLDGTHRGTPELAIRAQELVA